MLSKTLSAWFAAILLSCPPAYADDTVTAGIAQALRQEGLSGAVWSLVEPGKSDCVGAAGMADATDGRPLAPDAKVHVGSVAKTVLAAGVLRLVSAGRLTLDTEVARLLPQLVIDNPWQRSDPVRVRHLLDHSAGLENFRFSQVFSLQATPDMPLADVLARTPGILAIHARPGSHYAYSSTGYHLLGMVIEAVAGMRYERYLDEELLAPLGMGDSTFRFLTQAGAGADARLAMGHFEGERPHPAIPVFLRPAVQFTTTAPDMARMARFLMGDGRIDGHPFIDPQLLGALGAPSGTLAALAGLDKGHGLALAMRDRHGAVGQCHPGDSIGFKAMLCLYPRQQKAYFIAFNMDSETADYDRFNRSLIGALALASPRAPAPASAPADIARWQGSYVPTASAVRTLRWTDAVFNTAEVRWDGRRLALRPMQGKPLALAPAGGRLFVADGRIEPSHVLFELPDGERRISDGIRSYRQVSKGGVLAQWTSTALGLAGLLYVLSAGSWRLARRRLTLASPLVLPLLGVAMLVAAVPLFATQSFLRLGDLTPASLLLAAATAFLPLAMLAGLVQAWRLRGRAGRLPAVDAAALAAALQWLLVLAAWGALPVILWR